MSTVELIVNENDGERRVIGTAEVDDESGHVVQMEVTDPIWAAILMPPGHYSIGKKKR